MNFRVLLVVIMTFSCLSAAESNMQLSIWEGTGMANPAGATYNITYLELAGKGMSGYLEMNFSLQVNEIFGFRDIRRKTFSTGSYQIFLNPRFDLNEFLAKDLTLGSFRRWYISGFFQGRSDDDFSGEYYSIGISSDLALPYCDRFVVNIHKNFIHINQLKSGQWQASFENAGWLLKMDWQLPLKHISNDLMVTYQGWASFGFANNWAEENFLGPDENGIQVLHGTSSEYQMFNGIYWNMRKWAISTSFKLNRHIYYRDSENHAALSLYFGLHRKF